MRKTNIFARHADLVQVWHSFVVFRLVAAIPIILLGVSVGRAETFSVSEPRKESAPSMSAWGGDSSSDSHESSRVFSAVPVKSWRFLLRSKDFGNPWNPMKKSLPDDEVYPDASSVSGPRTSSVPVAISDAAEELQSIPMDDPVADGIPPWDRAPADAGLTRPYAGNAGTLEASPPAAALGARARGDSIDFSVPEAVRGRSKVDFSSAESESIHLDPSDGPGDLVRAGDAIVNPPQGPIAQIASPEPSVTALWGLSALLFASCGKMRSRSRS